MHTRRIAVIASALDRVREESQTWEVIKASGRYSDGSALAIDSLHDDQKAFADLSWYAFRDVLHHALAVLERCRPADRAEPRDAAALDRLEGALARGEEVLADWSARHGDLRPSPQALPFASYAQAKAERDARMRPVIEAWLADGDAFLRHARAATPASSRPSGTGRGVTALPPALPAPPGSTPARR